jgi:hypothetical protein
MGATKFPNGLTAASGEAVPTIATAGVTRVACGEAAVTGATLDVVTGLAVITSVQVSLGEDPGASAGDVFSVSVTKHATAGTITIAIWQDDATAATEDTTVFWTAWGT